MAPNKYRRKSWFGGGGGSKVEPHELDTKRTPSITLFRTPKKSDDSRPRVTDDGANQDQGGTWSNGGLNESQIEKELAELRQHYAASKRRVNFSPVAEENGFPSARQLDLTPCAPIEQPQQPQAQQPQPQAHEQAQAATAATQPRQEQQQAQQQVRQEEDAQQPHAPPPAQPPVTLAGEQGGAAAPATLATGSASSQETSSVPAVPDTMLTVVSEQLARFSALLSMAQATAVTLMSTDFKSLYVQRVSSHAAATPSSSSSQPSRMTAAPGAGGAEMAARRRTSENGSSKDIIAYMERTRRVAQDQLAQCEEINKVHKVLSANTSGNVTPRRVSTPDCTVGLSPVEVLQPLLSARAGRRSPLMLSPRPATWDLHGATASPAPRPPLAPQPAQQPPAVSQLALRPSPAPQQVGAPRASPQPPVVPRLSLGLQVAPPPPPPAGAVDEVESPGMCRVSSLNLDLLCTGIHLGDLSDVGAPTPTATRGAAPKQTTQQKGGSPAALFRLKMPSSHAEVSPSSSATTPKLPSLNLRGLGGNKDTQSTGDQTRRLMMQGLGSSRR